MRGPALVIDIPEQDEKVRQSIFDMLAEKISASVDESRDYGVIDDFGPCKDGWQNPELTDNPSSVLEIRNNKLAGELEIGNGNIGVTIGYYVEYSESIDTFGLKVAAFANMSDDIRVWLKKAGLKNKVLCYTTLYSY